MTAAVVPAEPVLFWLFMAVWGTLGIGGAIFFWGHRDARLKRAAYRWFVISAGVLFCLFVLLMTRQPEIVALMVPVVALISYLNIRLTKFCDVCGATLHNVFGFGPARFCSRCGAPLDGEGPDDTARGG